MQIVLIAIGIVSIVCWIMTLIKIFKTNIGLGILGIICGLFAFIYGWMKANEWNHKNVMLVWTAAILISIVIQVLFGASMMSQLQESMPQ